MKPRDSATAVVTEGLADSPARALPAGAWLDEFVLEEIIVEGSVTIVYAATNRALDVPVSIAEYIPAQLAQRNDEGQVTPRTSAQADAFAKGLKAFVDETRTLARCDHPSLVRITHLFEVNSTAYRVMPRYTGMRLLEVRQDMNEPPDEEALRALLDDLLGALLAFHHTGEGHGNVTPSNILLLADNRPLLLGPGAAGRAIASEPIDGLMTSVEPCFAPIEQIIDADIPLHPSVDLYALAGVARYWMSGELPAPAFGASTAARRERLAQTVQRLRLTWPRLRYSASLLDALDSTLSIYPAERPQSVAEMRARLDTAPPTTGGPVTAPPTIAPEPNETSSSSSAPASPAAPPAGVTQALDAVIAFAPDADPPAASGVVRIDDDPSALPTLAHQVPNPRRIAMWSGAALVLLALMVVGMLVFHEERQAGGVLDALGIDRGARAGDSVAASASAVDLSTPVTPPIAADATAEKLMPTEPVAVDSPASASATASPGSNHASPAAETASPPVVASPPAPTSPPTRVSQQQASRAAASPREFCGARTQFSLYRCMQTQCSQPRWKSHAQCERLRSTDSVD